MKTPHVKLVGILNITPDSFYDGGQYLEQQHAIFKACELMKQGASLLDVGAEATNPWAAPISANEEWQRLEHILPQIIQLFPNKISLDTHHPETVERAMAIGPIIINDVTMFRDPEMIRVAAKYKARCIVSHIPIADIATAHKTSLDDITIVRDELLAKRDELIAAGVPAKGIVLDPGIGFGKTMELNVQLLKFAEQVSGIPVMIGHSNKRVIAFMSGKDKTDIDANLDAAKIAITSGASYLRVHEVSAHKRLVELTA